MPATAWLVAFFVLPFYATLAVAFGTVDVFRTPRPVWQPWWWTDDYAADVLSSIFGGDAYLQGAFIRTFVYVVVASGISLVLGYAIAYFVARRAGRWKGLLLVLLLMPLWVSYLMRMVAWINLLQVDGYVNRMLQWFQVIDAPVSWLEGNPVTVVFGLIYGYIPFVILPLYAFLDRIDDSLLEASSDLGASRAETFMRVTLPLSKPAIVTAIVLNALPMLGDYYTNNLLSNSPRTTMIGNLIDDSTDSPEGAVLVLIVMVVVLIPMALFLRSGRYATELS